MASLCDKCYAPGQCCKALALVGSAGPLSGEEARVQIALQELPFKEHLQGNAAGLFYCTKLQPDGRCGDYENRPYLCREFEPGADPLCVHWRGAEGAEAWG